MSAALLERCFPEDRHCMDGFFDNVESGLPVHGRILDLGCGDNSILERFRTGNREVWGTDFDAHPNMKHKEWFRLLEPDGRVPFPDDFFDTVACISVMEHVEEPEVFLGEISRVLRPRGKFVGHSISGAHYVTGIRRIIGLLPHSFNQYLVRVVYGRPDVDTFPAFYRLNGETIIREVGAKKI